MSFYIPQGDHESGLSGYALWSCNRVNAVHGCTACGARGVVYEDWYVQERPDAGAKNQDFLKGSGYIGS